MRYIFASLVFLRFKLQEKRFHNWLENARDWAVSRSRFWGTPLPVWVSEDGEEILVMDSIEKLEKLSGVKVSLFISQLLLSVNIIVSCSKGKKKLLFIESIIYTLQWVLFFFIKLFATRSKSVWIVGWFWTSASFLNEKLSRQDWVF